MAEDAMQLLTAPQVAERGHAHADTIDRPEKVTMSPPLRRATDITKTTVPLPFMLTIIGLVVTIAGGVWRIDARVSVIDARYQMQKEIEVERAKYLDQRFEAVEAKIESAGLRNAAMSLSQELMKAQEKLKGRE